MYPQQLLDSEVKSQGERKVFTALRDGLPNSWEAYHSASLIERDPIKGSDDSEIDFVLCHPDEAIVCLEVKGGALEARGREWYRPGPEKERIKDPFAQAIDNAWALRRKLSETDGRKPRELPIVHAVALPDVSVHKLALAADAPAAIVLDRSDVREDVSGAIERVLGFHRGQSVVDPPGLDGAKALRDLLAPPVTLEVPMAERFLDEHAALIELSNEQSVLLRAMRRESKLAVYGCAGSGKTMLAVAHAKHLAGKDQKVVFVCFNRGLADHLKAAEGKSGVLFTTFHGLCISLVKRAGIKLSQWPADDPPPEYWETELPEALVEAVGELGELYDAVILDEAQDLHPHWLDALTLTLRDPAKSAIWLFLDDNQTSTTQPSRSPRSSGPGSSRSTAATPRPSTAKS